MALVQPAPWTVDRARNLSKQVLDHIVDPSRPLLVRYVAVPVLLEAAFLEAKAIIGHDGDFHDLVCTRIKHVHAEHLRPERKEALKSAEQYGTRVQVIVMGIAALYDLPENSVRPTRNAQLATFSFLLESLAHIIFACALGRDDILEKIVTPAGLADFLVELRAAASLP